MQAMMIGLMRMAQSIGAAAAQIPEQDSTILYSRTSFTIGIKKVRRNKTSSVILHHILGWIGLFLLNSTK